MNNFLGEIVNGLTAKVFRTYHASNTVENYFSETVINDSDPEFMKKEVAVMANREAAIICNHIKQEPKNWANRIQKFRERKIKADERAAKDLTNQKNMETKLEEIKRKFDEQKNILNKQELAWKEMTDNLKLTNNPNDGKTTKNEQEKMKKKIDTQKKNVVAAKKKLERLKNQLEKSKNRVGTAKEKVYKAKQALKQIESQERIAKNTKTWNLGTSLKSYIDPRIYYQWGKEVDYDWRNYYNAALQRKFSWIEREDES